MATSKMTRTQRKENAEVREARRAAERLRRQRTSFRKHNTPTWGGRMAHMVRSWPLGARRIIVAAFVALAAATIWWAAVDTANHNRDDRQLVQAITARDVQVVKRSSDWFAPKSGPWVDVEIDGTPVRLEHGMFNARDLPVGSLVAVAVDPADRNHVVAVGTPGDWDDIAGDAVAGALGGALAGQSSPQWSRRCSSVPRSRHGGPGAVRRGWKRLPLHVRENAENDEN